AANVPGTGTINATEGQSFNGEVAGFVDSNTSNTAADFTATIDWGDGSTTSGTVTGSGSGGFTVNGTHTYAEEGSFTASVTLRDDNPGTATATATHTAIVSDALLTAAGTTLNLTAGVAANNVVVATFTDDGGPEPV